MIDHDTIEDIINEFAPLIRLPIPSMEHPDVKESNQRGYAREFARRIIEAYDRTLHAKIRSLPQAVFERG